jgi:7,8-dihydropterin-6-yl-methyl-4-(beta-D-ribofuranosyl)aminobenzene 5'-phosphate synthase
MKRAVCRLAGFAALVLAGQVLSAQGTGVRLTYLYDNTVAVQGTKAEWGFACLIEGNGHTLLFDTGAQAAVLRQNMAALKVDPARIEAVVLSHEHSDHTVGLDALPSSPGLPVHLGEHFTLPPPAVAALERIGAKRVPMTAGKPVQFFPGFTVSEEIARNNAYEDALILDTPEGSVVIVGCAHPGIVAMLRRIAETTKKPIHMVIGGFHLLQTSPEEVKKIVADFKAMGIAWTGPTHCIGDGAMKLFREAYGDHFIAGSVGTVVNVPMVK